MSLTPHQGKKVVLVTGASGGIGKAVAIRLAKDGFHVLLHYHKNAAGAEEGFTQIQQAGGSAEVICFDVKNREQMESVLEKHFVPESGRVPFGLVNNAGLHRDNLAALMSDAEFEEVIDTNLFGPFYLMRYCAKKLIRERQGCIVNMASLAGQTGNAGQLNYSASKAGLIAMTKTLAMEVGSRGVRVNAVAPGLIETEMVKDIPQIENFIARIPMRRMGKAEEVAGAVSFLFSNDATYITGHTISINGGLYPS